MLTPYGYGPEPSRGMLALYELVGRSSKPNIAIFKSHVQLWQQQISLQTHQGYEVCLQMPARHQGQSRCSLADESSDDCDELPLRKILVCMPLQGLSRRINCLTVHPSRPHLCVTGASSGTLAVWDLRMTSAPAVQSTSKPGSGDVLEVGNRTKSS